MLNEWSFFWILKVSIFGISVELNIKILYVIELKFEYKYILVLLKIFIGIRYWWELFVMLYSGVKFFFGCFR